MCLELLVGTALSAGGGMIARNEANAAAGAEAKARNKEVKALNAKADTATAANQGVLGNTIRDSLNPANLGLAQTSRVGAAESNLPGAAMPEMAFASDAPQVVQAEYAKRMMEALDKSKTTAGNLGRLAGFGQQQVDLGLGINKAQQDIGFNNDPVSGQARIMPHLQDYRAIEAYRPSSGLGQVMQAAGSLIGGMPMGGGAPSSGVQGYFGKTGYGGLGTAGMFGGPK